MAQAQSPIIESANFGPIYDTGQGAVFNDYNPNSTGTNVPLTSMYVYITVTAGGSGILDGTGGTPTITVVDKITLNNIPTFSVTASGGFTASGPLASGSTESFTISGSPVNGSEQVTQNLVNYTGTGTFTINVDEALQSVTVTGGNYDQNNSTFPVSGTVIVSFNGPYSPVPEPRDYGIIFLGGAMGLLVIRKLRSRFSPVAEGRSMTAE